MGKRFGDIGVACRWANDQLKSYGSEIDAGRWQGVATEGRPDMVTREIMDLSFEVPMYRQSWSDESPLEWEAEIAFESGCNMLWADEHFAERVGGVPRNPDPSYQNWPWWQGGYQEAQSMIPSQTETGDFEFTHTYSERFWPPRTIRGIRYGYGDYGDVLALLQSDPFTRQAYLPIFFPEDTGAVHRGRIPCSLGYHFLLRHGQLHCWYDIRSCDAVRHFRDDLYLAIRLVGHTLIELQSQELMSDRDQVWNSITLGTLHFNAHSFHAHMGDWHRL